MVRNGIDNLTPYRRQLAGKRLGLVTNPSGITRQLAASIDILAARFNLVRLFGPEHGVRGDRQAGEAVQDDRDPRWQIPVFSTYGRPLTPAMLDGLDAMLFDLQDIGVRYYTYIHTLNDLMRDCAQAGLPLIVLDRINPLGGECLEGTLLDERFASFVGRTAIPVRHGLTIAEYALYLNHTYQIGCELTVIPCAGWQRRYLFEETGLPWVNPSPNMPSARTAALFCGTCLIEGTNLSEGRGTTTPFELVGAPFLDGTVLAERMNCRRLPGVCLRPCYFTPQFSKHQGKLCCGVQLHLTDRIRFNGFAFGVTLLETLREMLPDLKMTSHLDHLLGSDAFRLGQIDAATLCRQARRDCRRFAEKSRPFQLYS